MAATEPEKLKVVCYPCVRGRHKDCYKLSRYHGPCCCTKCGGGVKKQR